MAEKRSSAFVTTKKGFCYLSVKIGRRSFPLMRIRQYTIDAEDKRDLRRLHPDVDFDWKKIAKQLAEKREECRSYRARRQPPRQPRAPQYAVYDPLTRTVYADIPTTAGGAGALLDAILSLDRRLTADPYPSPSEERCRALARLDLKHFIHSLAGDS